MKTALLSLSSSLLLLLTLSTTTLWLLTTVTATKCENDDFDANDDNDDVVELYHRLVADTPTHHLGGSSFILQSSSSSSISPLHRGSRTTNRQLSKTGDDDKKKEKEERKKAKQEEKEKRRAEKLQKKVEKYCYQECDPTKVVLSEYPQWEDETGYWIGEYTFYQADGTPFTSSNWNYRYDSYRGFITGNVVGNAYRQRNVFMYPPQFDTVCDERGNDGIVGTGECGVNGNTKIFAADQNATTCSVNPELGGDISGPFAGVFDTSTELIGRMENNALLYQVYLFGALFQSQLTTISKDTTTNQVRRTRTAQNFANGAPRSSSYFRERKVNKTKFYEIMAETIIEYNIQVSDTCTWIDNPSFNPPVIDTGLEPGIIGCTNHLEESFEL